MTGLPQTEAQSIHASAVELQRRVDRLREMCGRKGIVTMKGESYRGTR